MLDTERVLLDHFPNVANNKFLHKPASLVLKSLLCAQEINAFSEKHPHLSGFDYIEEVLHYFSFGYSLKDAHRERIPEAGRVIIIANHPIGSLDGMALIKCVREIRSDVKVVANEMLMSIKAMHEVLLPVDNMQGNTAKQNLRNIGEHLQGEGALIIFPAGEVSRLRPSGVKDTKWHHGFIRLAKLHRCPILPVHIDAKNSALFYGVSMLFKPAATAMLVKEMFYQKDKTILFSIGDIIPYESFASLALSTKEQVKLFKKHLYRIGKNKSPIFATQSAIAPPEERRLLIKALEKECEELGRTCDKKVIYLYRYTSSSPVMRELGRLRELTFRAVGEGTNRRRDVDKYDKHYIHLILWDEKELEIAGAYRFGDARKSKPEDLYSASLFNYSTKMQPIFDEGLELGRSFVQKKYWGKRSLDYLWMGIGAFLRKHPEYRYLFGPVTISGSFPQEATDLISAFYQYYFPQKNTLATAKLPFINQVDASVFFGNLNYHQGYQSLKRQLANYNVVLPTLYKQYADVCDEGGVSFSAFNIDPDFENCVDGLVVVDISKLSASKRKRYLEEAKLSS